MDNEKFVDESWKDAVAGEKSDPGGCGEGSCDEGCAESSCGHEHGDRSEQGELQVNFLNYIMSMAYQAMIFLGEVPNPMTGQSEQNLRQAKFLIDTLQLVKEKTKGNLDPSEENMLGSSLYELQMKYVELSQKGKLV
jgi:hypothetical protein